MNPRMLDPRLAARVGYFSPTSLQVTESHVLSYCCALFHSMEIQIDHIYIFVSLFILLSSFFCYWKHYTLCSKSETTDPSEPQHQTQEASLTPCFVLIAYILATCFCLVYICNILCQICFRYCDKRTSPSEACDSTEPSRHTEPPPTVRSF